MQLEYTQNNLFPSFASAHGLDDRSDVMRKLNDPHLNQPFSWYNAIGAMGYEHIKRKSCTPCVSKVFRRDGIKYSSLFSYLLAILR